MLLIKYDIVLKFAAYFLLHNDLPYFWFWDHLKYVPSIKVLFDSIYVHKSVQVLDFIRYSICITDNVDSK